jgi:hypothetical protein
MRRSGGDVSGMKKGLWSERDSRGRDGAVEQWGKG